MFKSQLSRLIFVAVVTVGSLCSKAAFAEQSLDFSDYYERIFQIRVVSPDAGSKSSIGSGFQVSADGHVVTNYHVVSDYIDSPNTYHIEYAAQDGTTGSMELLDFDIISDLAILRHTKPNNTFFKLQAQMPVKGTLAYALGNPGDWGMVMVPGPTNGLVEHSYEERVLFSGSLNPGMSGGPSLNAAGDVIGVNVATAGSQLSFLVPAEKAQQLLNRNRTLDSGHYLFEIAKQIKQWQRPRIQALLDEPWPVEYFMDRDLFGEIRNDFQCWGETNETDEERVIASVQKWCGTTESVYINQDFNAGQINFYFEDLHALKLNQFQFARAQHLYMSADNSSSYEQSTTYQCESAFIDTEGNSQNSYNKVITCIRAYKKLPGLFDSLLMVFHSDGDKVFQSQLSLSAMEQNQLAAFHKRFIEASL